MMLRKTLLCSALLTTCALLGFSYVQDKDEEGFVTLFNGKDLTGFKVVLQGNKENVDTFVVKDGAIHVSGKPNGFLHTEKAYKNYVLRYDWECVKNSANNLLLHINGELKVWPTCVEFWNSKTFNFLSTKGTKKSEGQAWNSAVKQGKDAWNAVEIISQDGTLTVKMNGTQVLTGKCEELTGGHIALMSEGGNFQVKNIRIKEMP